MNLYLVRADNIDGQNEDRLVIAESQWQAVEVWQAESDYDEAFLQSFYPDGFIVHRVFDLDYKFPGEPRALDWSFGEVIPIG